MADFHVRYASSAGDDAQFILAAFDSTLQYLASIGAGAMWGEKPFSEREGFEQDTIDSVYKSERQEDATRIFIAEIEGPGAANAAPDATYTPEDTEQGAHRPARRTGAAMVRHDSLPTYVTERQELQPEVGQARDFLFLEVVVSDYRTGPLRRGAGAALIEAVKRHGREHGRKTLYVGCWAGNGVKLNRYYEKQGFRQGWRLFLWPSQWRDLAGHSLSHASLVKVGLANSVVA